jgi:hypothetical protein
MGLAMDGMRGAIELHMRAGDAVIFVDSLAHGSVRRSKPVGTHQHSHHRAVSTDCRVIMN